MEPHQHFCHQAGQAVRRQGWLRLPYVRHPTPAVFRSFSSCCGLATKWFNDEKHSFRLSVRNTKSSFLNLIYRCQLPHKALLSVCLAWGVADLLFCFSSKEFFPRVTQFGLSGKHFPAACTSPSPPPVF